MHATKMSALTSAEMICIITSPTNELVENGTNFYDSIGQAVSQLADGSSECQVDNCGRRRTAGALSISRQPECRSRRTTLHRPALC